MKRKLLLVLFGIGTIGGFSSAIAHAKYRHGCHSWKSPHGWPARHHDWRGDDWRQAAAPPAPIVQQPAPQVFVITVPQGNAAPATVQVQAPATPGAEGAQGR